MRRLGENSYYKEFLRPKLNEILGDTPYKIEHINGKRKCVLHTDRVEDDVTTAISAILESVLPKNIEVMQYNHNMEISWRDINKYAECVTLSQIMSVNADYKNDITSDGWWIYPLPKYNDNYSTKIFNNSNIEHMRFEGGVRVNAHEFLAFSQRSVKLSC